MGALKKLGIVAVGLFAILIIAAGATWWLASRQSTLEWLVAEAVRRTNGALTVEGVSGSLLGPIRVRRIIFENKSMRAALEDVRLDASPRDLARGSFLIANLEARALVVETKPSNERPQPPESLALPVRVRIVRASIASADIAGHSLRDLTFAYEGDSAAQVLKTFRADSAAGHIDVDLRVQGAAPFELGGAATLSAPELTASARLSGSLLHPEIGGEAAIKQAHAKGSVRLAPFETVWLEALELNAHGVDLASLRHGLPATVFEIQITGSGVAGSLAGGRVFVSNRRAGPLDAGRLPLEKLNANFLVRGETLELTNARVDLGRAGTLAGRALLNRKSGRAELSVAALDLRAFYGRLRQTQLHGTTSIEFSETEQRAKAALTQRGINLAFDAMRRGDMVTVKEAQVGVGGGSARGHGQFSLAQPRRYSADLAFESLDPSRLGDFPQAALNGQIALVGALAPEWHADATLKLVGNSTWRGVRLSGTAMGQVSARGVRDFNVDLTAGTNTLRAQGSFGRPTDEFTFELAAKRLAELDRDVTGVLRARGRIAGDMENLRFDADVDGESLRWKTGPLIAQLQVQTKGTAAQHVVTAQARGARYDMTARLEGGWSRQNGWTGNLASFENKGPWPATLSTPMTITYAEGRFSAGKAEMRVAGGRVALSSFEWREGRIATRGEIEHMPVAPWLELAGAPASRTDLRLGGNWTFAATPRLNGMLTLTRESGDIVTPDNMQLPLQLQRLRLEARIVDDAIDATLEIVGGWLRGNAKGRMTALARDAPIQVSGNVELGSLRLLESLMDTRVVLSGRAAASFTVAGTLSVPQVTGLLTASGIGAEAPQYGIRVSDGTLRAELDDAALHLHEFRIRGANGYITATGTMSRRDDGGARLEWRAQDFQALDRPDMQLRVAGAGTAGLEAKKLTLRGNLIAQQGVFRFDQPQAPKIASDIVVVGRPRTEPPAGLRTRFESQLLDVDIALEVLNQVHLRGAGINSELSGKVRLQTNQRGVVQAYGTLDSNRGTYIAFGQQLSIERGRLIFDGPIENPALDILAKRRTMEVEVGVEITGTVRVPRVQLVSEPPMPDNEKLAWLTLGRGLQDASGADLALLQGAASALLGNGDSVPLTRRVADKLGLDDISLRGGGEAGSQVAAVGKRLSDRLYIEYQQGLKAATTAMRLSYALTRAFSLRLEAGDTSSLGIVFNRSYP